MEQESKVVQLTENYIIPKKKFFRISSERQEIISKFELELNNEERLKMGFKEISPMMIIVLIKRKFKKADTKTLRWFYAECKDSRHFSKYFWWKIKQKDLKLF
jgi:hypothetical protein